MPDIEIEVDPIDQNERKKDIIKDFKRNKILRFNHIFNIKKGRDNVIVNFLIILDMIKDGVLTIIENEKEIEFEYKGNL